MREVEVFTVRERLGLPTHALANRFGKVRHFAVHDGLLVGQRRRLERSFERLRRYQTVRNGETDAHMLTSSRVP